MRQNFRSSIIKLPTEEKYTTKISDCKFWYDCINYEIFDFTLPRVLFEIKILRKNWAYYEYWPRIPDRPLKIVMSKYYTNKKLFVECMAHEMIHHWQYLNFGASGVDHGEEFLDWCDEFDRRGLLISETQG